MTAEELRSYFPILDGRGIVYFDNAATAQRPLSVVEFMSKANLEHNANIHRAVHTLSAEATDAYEAARNAVVDFIGAASREEVVFTSGATAALNTVAYSFGEKFVGEGDEIIVGVAEHHSNLVPWQLLAERKQATVKYLGITPDGRYAPEELDALITPKTRIVCLTHASNVLGVVNPVKELVAVAHRHNVPILIDGSQGIVHKRVNVKDLGCDFYTFSAHKLYGPTGVGVLYGKKEWLEKMPPFLSGGEMVGTVTLQGTSFAPLPAKFEAGTQNFINAAAIKPALELAAKILDDRELNEELERVKEYIMTELGKVEGLRLYGKPGDGADKLPVFSFTIDGVHHEDLAILLDKMGVAVRSGQMCAEPLMTLCGTTGMLRASLLPYNTMAEAEKFITSLHRAVKMLK